MIDYRTVQLGQRVVLDGETECVITKTSVYVNASQTRETGVSVRPVAGGRARPVSLSRLTYPEGGNQ